MKKNDKHAALFRPESDRMIFAYPQVSYFFNFPSLILATVFIEIIKVDGLLPFRFFYCQF